MTEKLEKTWQEKWLGPLSGLMIVAVLLATLVPFNFFPPNRVSWLTDEKGIVFSQSGVVISKEPLTAHGSDPGKGCSLEVLVRPASTEGVHTLLGIYVANNPRQLLLRQWTDELLVSHDSREAKNKLRKTQIDVDKAFQDGKLVLLTVVSGPEGTLVYANGNLAEVSNRLKMTSNEITGRVVLGNSPEELEPWEGELHGLAIYSRELSMDEVQKHYRSWTDKHGLDAGELESATAAYMFSEGTGREIHNAVSGGPNLEIPKIFQIPQKPFLKSPVKEFEWSENYLNDVLRNIVGFVPLGFLLCGYFALTRSRGQAILYATLCGGMLSFVIEVLQVYVPQRYSGVTDIITNTTGAAIGAVLARPELLVRLMGKRKPEPAME